MHIELKTKEEAGRNRWEMHPTKSFKARVDERGKILEWRLWKIKITSIINR